MDHEITSIDEFDLMKYLQNSNDINILISASFYGETRIGKYKCRLFFREHTKVLAGCFEQVNSPNHAMILGLLEAVKHINLHKVNVCIISGIYVGFKSAAKGKGLYAKEINRLVDIVEGQGNSISSIVITDGMNVIKKVINDKYGSV